MTAARKYAGMHFICARMLFDCTGTEDAYLMQNFYWLACVLHDEEKQAKWFGDGES